MHKPKAFLSAAIALLLSGGLPLTADAAGFTFTRIADTSTPLPGGNGNFTAFNYPPSISAGTIAFAGLGAAGSMGIFTYDINSSILSSAVSTTTLVPGSSGNFAAFGAPSLDGAQLAFRGINANNQDGVYSLVGGVLSTVADTSTTFPGSTDGFSAFGDPSFSAGKAVFRGFHSSDSKMGVYAAKNGTLSTLADKKVTLQGGGSVFSYGSPSVRGSQIAISGVTSTMAAIANIVSGAPTQIVAQTTTPIPGGNGTFTGFAFDGVSAKSGSIAFKGYGTNGQQGIYTWVNGVLNVVADTNTVTPGGSVKFTQFGTPALDNGNVAFWATDANGQEAIYTNFPGSLTLVSKAGDTVDGGVVQHLDIGREGFSGTSLAFCAIFGSSANACDTIYRVQLQ